MISFLIFEKRSPSRYILRLQEIRGEKRKLRIKFKHRFIKAILCDILEREIKPIEIKENDIELETRPFEIHTLKLHFAE